MTYLFDTNIVSELRRPERANSAALAWSRSISRDDAHISVISLLEIERGIQRAERQASPAAGSLRRWMHEQVLPAYAATTLPVTVEIALRAAQYDQLPTVELADQLIAATAWAHGLVLVTRNEKHFAGTGIRILNPFG